MSASACPLCSSRKARRACPALHQVICPACCGSKRLTEIACPPSCSYLSSARAHPPAVVQRRQERDLRFLLPVLADLSEPQYALLLMFQALVVRHAKGAIPPLVDLDVAEAAAAAAATLETAGKGIIYEHQAASVPAQRLADEFNAVGADLRQKAGAGVRAVERDLGAALRRLEHAARSAAAALAGDEPPVYLRLAARVMAQRERAEGQGTAGAGEPEGGGESRLILP